MKSLKKIIESVSYEENKIHTARKALKELIDVLESGGYSGWDKNKLKAIMINQLKKIYNSLEI